MDTLSIHDKNSPRLDWSTYLQRCGLVALAPLPPPLPSSSRALPVLHMISARKVMSLMTPDKACYQVPADAADNKMTDNTNTTLHVRSWLSVRRL